MYAEAERHVNGQAEITRAAPRGRTSLNWPSSQASKDEQGGRPMGGARDRSIGLLRIAQRHVWPRRGNEFVCRSTRLGPLDQHQIIGFVDREGRDDGRVLAAHVHGDDPEPPRPWRGIRRSSCACRNRFRRRQDELLLGAQLGIALRRQGRLFAAVVVFVGSSTGIRPPRRKSRDARRSPVSDRRGIRPSRHPNGAAATG